MSFALSMDDGALEWGSHDLSTVFAQRKTWTSPSHWRMVWEVVRFGREAPKVRATSGLVHRHVRALAGRSAVVPCRH